MTEGYFIPNLAIFKNLSRADPIRISQKVKKNMLKNNNDYQLGPSGQGTDDKDIILKSRDQEIVFERGNEADDADGDRGNRPQQKRTIEEINNEFSGAKEGDVNMIQ